MSSVQLQLKYVLTCFVRRHHENCVVLCSDLVVSRFQAENEHINTKQCLRISLEHSHHQDTKMTLIIPQCGVPSFTQHMEDEDCRKEEQSLSEKIKQPNHDYKCNEGLHDKTEVDQSRLDFNWKVVEPFEGKREGSSQNIVFF